jgi:CubicO group peptidase (beta-lactamase class C family)/predicted negative regulator of RcsB-dependent stress response
MQTPWQDLRHGAQMLLKNPGLALVVAFTLLWPTATAISQSAAPPATDKYADKLRLFEEFARRQMEKDKTPGITIGFYKDDYTWVKGFGYADLENKVPATANSAYRLASITKTFTGVAILQLVEKGKMKLDEEIQTYLPYYPKQKWPVTVRQLLTHVGGGQEGSGLGPEYVTPRQVVERIAKYPIQTEPGTKFIYTTSGYNLLGAAIEEVTGQSFGDYMRENIWQPLGMSDTRMNSERELIANRVRGYIVENGQVKNIPFIDVSSRFGGGGAIGSVPDLMKWARGVDAGKMLAKESVELMYTPVATTGGRWIGISDGEWYYTLGWMQFPLNGQCALWNDGGQTGTNTALLRIPSKNLVIAFASNQQEVNRMAYLRRLYELITDEPFAIPFQPKLVYVKDRSAEALREALRTTFNYGAMHYERAGRPFAADARELAAAFAYFNQSVAAGSMQAVNDGWQPVAQNAFIKVGSWMAAKLREKHGAARAGRHHAMGEIAFFADYVALCQADAKWPREQRFSEAVEKLLLKWDEDWSRAWNDEARRVAITAETDFDAIGEKLKRAFANAEVYPNFIDALLSVQERPQSFKASKLAVDLYPQHPRTNAVWGAMLALADTSEERREMFKKAVGAIESPLEYFKKSLALNPDGLASARTLHQAARDWASQKRIDDATALLKVAVELHPKSAPLHDALGDLYQQKGQKELARKAYEKAVEADPNFEHAREMLKKLTP